MSQGGAIMPKQKNQTSLYEKELARYNKLAKKADRRMRELERLSRYKEFEPVLNYAYRTAKRDIESWTPPEGKDRSPRWQRNAPADTRTLQAKIRDIEKFLSKKTSTITGVKEVYIKRTNTINKKYGTDFTWEQLANYFESGFAEKSNDKYGSKTVLKAIGVIQKNKKDALDIIKNQAENNIQVSGKKVKDTVKTMLSENGVELMELLQ